MTAQNNLNLAQVSHFTGLRKICMHIENLDASIEQHKVIVYKSSHSIIIPKMQYQYRSQRYKLGNKWSNGGSRFLPRPSKCDFKDYAMWIASINFFFYLRWFLNDNCYYWINCDQILRISWLINTYISTYSHDTSWI